MQLSPTVLREPLRRQVELLSGEHLADCYQCGNCTAGCPTAYEMEHGPQRVIRLLQLGAGAELFKLNTPWMCASCEACATRCPKGISVAAVMDALRQLARMYGHRPPQQDPPIFNRRFLGSVKLHGRLYELQLGLGYNLSSGHFFNDVLSFPGLFLRGKLKILPQRSSKLGRRAVRRIFANVAAAEKRLKETPPAAAPEQH